MSCANQMHQTIILTQTAESDDEEIDVITVNVNEEKLSQDLEFDLWSKIEFEIDSDSDELIDVVTVSPVKHTSSKVLQINKNGANESRLTPSHEAAANSLSRKTSIKRNIDELDNDWDDEILRIYTSKRSKAVVTNESNDEPETLKSTSMFRKTPMINGKVADDSIDPVIKCEKRKESKNGQTSNDLDAAIDIVKLKSSVKIILSKTDVNSNDGIERDDKSTKKTLRKSVSQKSASSGLTVDKRSKRINNRQKEGGNKAAIDKDIEQTLLKPRRRCTRKSDKLNYKK